MVQLSYLCILLSCGWSYSDTTAVLGTMSGLFWTMVAMTGLSIWAQVYGSLNSQGVVLVAYNCFHVDAPLAFQL